MAEIDTETAEFQDAVKAEANKSNAGLKSALDKEKESARTAKSELGKFDGIDPGKYRTLVKDAENAEAERQKSVGDWTAREKKLQEGFDAQIKTVIGERDAFQSERDAGRTELDLHLREKAATEAILAEKGSLALLRDVVLKNTKLVEVDGKQVVQVLDDKGVPRLKDGAKSASDFMKIPEYVASLKENDEYAGAFQGTGATGSGSFRDAAGSQKGSGAAKRAADLKRQGVKILA